MFRFRLHTQPPSSKKNQQQHYKQQHYVNDNQGSKTVTLYSQPYLDTYNQCYKNIVTINTKPRGPLEQLVRNVQFPKLSEFKQSTPCNPIKKCGLALLSLDNYCYSCNHDLMIVDEIPNLVSFLAEHQYTFDTSLTKMFNTSEIRFDTNNGNKLIGFVTYNGENEKK